MTQTDNRLAQRQETAPRAFGDLPPSKAGLGVERALELAGVDATELALLASTTFKEARTLEELVTLIATTRRRGLDGMLRHVYYERFGGQNSDPSLHIAIDGLRAIAASTGRYGGRLEPRFSGTWAMPVDDRGETKSVPEKCTFTVYAIVQGHRCAFEGVAWMEESYPGSGMRGRMWRQRPRSMLAVAAERQALRSAFPAETTGIADVDEGSETEPAPRTTIAEQDAYSRSFSDEWTPHNVDPVTGEVIEPEPVPKPETEMVTSARSREAGRYADIVAEATRLDVKFDDLAYLLPIPVAELTRKAEILKARIQAKKDFLANPPQREEAAALL